MHRARLSQLKKHQQSMEGHQQFKEGHTRVVRLSLRTQGINACIFVQQKPWFTHGGLFNYLHDLPKPESHMDADTAL